MFALSMPIIMCNNLIHIFFSPTLDMHVRLQFFKKFAMVYIELVLRFGWIFGTRDPNGRYSI